jgi:hypothetical protein
MFLPVVAGSVKDYTALNEQDPPIALREWRAREKNKGN